MKRVTATQARREWFRLLDEVLKGETVVIERKGRRIFIRREKEPRGEGVVPDYAPLIEAPEVERAHEWSWEWPGPDGEAAVRESAQADADPEPEPDPGERGRPR